MNVALVWLIACATSIIFAAGAVILAYNNIDGWGWFMFASVLTGVSGSTARNDSEQ